MRVSFHVVGTLRNGAAVAARLFPHTGSNTRTLLDTPRSGAAGAGAGAGRPLPYTEAKPSVLLGTLTSNATGVGTRSRSRHCLRQAFRGNPIANQRTVSLEPEIVRAICVETCLALNLLAQELFIGTWYTPELNLGNHDSVHALAILGQS